eukprot:752138-Hanusia_phi.AAC.2
MVRLKSRYLIVEMIWSSTDKDCACPAGVSKGIVMQAVKDSVARNFGDVGMARLQNRMQSCYFGESSEVADEQFSIRSKIMMFVVWFIELLLCQGGKKRNARSEGVRRPGTRARRGSSGDGLLAIVKSVPLLRVSGKEQGCTGIDRSVEHQQVRRNVLIVEDRSFHTHLTCKNEFSEHHYSVRGPSCKDSSPRRRRSCQHRRHRIPRHLRRNRHLEVTQQEH